MNDRGASRCGPLDLAEVEKIVTVSLIEANDVMTEAGQMPGYRDTDVAPVAGHQNAHADHALADRRDLSPASSPAIISPGRTVVAMIGLAIATYGWTALPVLPARLGFRRVR